MSKICEIRKTILPDEIFKLIEGYMTGDLKALHIIAVARDGSVIRRSAGAIPEFIAANDSDAATINKALS